MNRNVNQGVELNKQRICFHYLVWLMISLKNDYLINLIGKELNTPKEDILDFDLFLYEVQKGPI